MNRRLSVLCELRPAFVGFCGISNETRLMFSLMHEMDDVEVTGLINHPSLPLARALTRNERPGKPARTIKALSRFVASTTPRMGWHKTATALNYSWLQLLTTIRTRIPLDRFNGTDFGDFLWQTLFWMSLPPSDFERCRTARYATLWAPWDAMHTCALFPWSRRYARVDTWDMTCSWPRPHGPAELLRKPSW